MFDFQNLKVYQKARLMHKKVLLVLRNNKKIPRKLDDQLSRAALSVMLNIAEGSGRFTKPDKRRFYIQSRSSAFESVSCLEACFDIDAISQLELSELEDGYEEISKMLFKMINN